MSFYDVLKSYLLMLKIRVDSIETSCFVSNQ